MKINYFNNFKNKRTSSTLTDSDLVIAQLYMQKKKIVARSLNDFLVEYFEMSYAENVKKDIYKMFAKTLLKNNSL